MFIQFYIILISQGVSAFQQTHHHCQVSIRISHSNHNLLLYNNNNKGNEDDNNNNIWTGISSLWDEIIEMSTYGPSERKMLKVQRERQMQRQVGTSKAPPTDDQGSSANNACFARVVFNVDAMQA